MNSLLEFKKFVDEILLDNSRKHKIEILTKYKDNESIKYFLNFIYNPYITTGISDKKLSRVIDKTLPRYIAFSLKELLEYIKHYNTGRDQDIVTVQDFRDSIIPEEDKPLFDKIITKNLQLGIDILTINKCIPNLIPTLNVMLANKYFEKQSYVEGKRFAITTKIDGGRIIALKENNEVSFYTRAGQKYEGLVDLEEELKNLPLDNICFDGEITLLNPYVIETDNEGKPAIGRKMSSKEQYKETMKITRKDGEKHSIKMLVFDVMTAQQFKNQKCENTYYERRAYLNQIFSENKSFKSL